MFKSKEKVTFQDFMNQYYIPLIREVVYNEVDALYDLIGKNEPSIKISKEETEFELFILFLKTSGVWFKSNKRN